MKILKKLKEMFGTCKQTNATVISNFAKQSEKSCSISYFIKSLLGSTCNWLLSMNFVKITAIVVVNCFLLTAVYGQAAVMVADGARAATQFKQIFSDFELPYSYGKISSVDFKNSDKIVINIQDLHSHAGVQKNINNIIELFDKKYGVRNIYVEGAYGNVSTKWLTNVKNEDLRNTVIEGLLNAGRLTGAEYYSAKSGKTEIIKGLESKNEYLDNLKRFGLIVTNQEILDIYFKEIDISVKSLQNDYYNRQQKKIEQLSKDYVSGVITPKKYFTLMKKYADKLGVDISSYENLSLYINLMEMQKTINYEKTTNELQVLVLKLKEVLPYGAYKMLLEGTKNFQQMDKLYGYIIKLSKKYNFEISQNFPNLEKFFAYIELTQRINPLELVTEEQNFKDEINDRFAVNRAEEEVIFLSNFVNYYKAYLSGKITSDDLKYYKDNVEKFKAVWVKYIDNRLIKALAEYEQTADKFYEINLHRNDYFISNMDESLEGSENLTSVEGATDLEKTMNSLSQAKEVYFVVAGGFHTQAISELLSQHNITNIVITPNVQGDTKLAEETYYKIAKEQSKINFQALATWLISEAKVGNESQFMSELFSFSTALRDAVLSENNDEAEAILNSLIGEEKESIKIIGKSDTSITVIFNNKKWNIVFDDDVDLNDINNELFSKVRKDSKIASVSLSDENKEDFIERVNNDLKVSMEEGKTIQIDEEIFEKNEDLIKSLGEKGVDGLSFLERIKLYRLNNNFIKAIFFAIQDLFKKGKIKKYNEKETSEDIILETDENGNKYIELDYGRLIAETKEQEESLKKLCGLQKAGQLTDEQIKKLADEMSDAFNIAKDDRINPDVVNSYLENNEYKNYVTVIQILAANALYSNNGSFVIVPTSGGKTEAFNIVTKQYLYENKAKNIESKIVYRTSSNLSLVQRDAEDYSKDYNNDEVLLIKNNRVYKVINGKIEKDEKGKDKPFIDCESNGQVDYAKVFNKEAKGKNRVVFGEATAYSFFTDQMERNANQINDKVNMDNIAVIIDELDAVLKDKTSSNVSGPYNHPRLVPAAESSAKYIVDNIDTLEGKFGKYLDGLDGDKTVYIKYNNLDKLEKELFKELAAEGFFTGLNDKEIEKFRKDFHVGDMFKTALKIKYGVKDYKFGIDYKLNKNEENENFYISLIGNDRNEQSKNTKRDNVSNLMMISFIKYGDVKFDGIDNEQETRVNNIRDNKDLLSFEATSTISKADFNSAVKYSMENGVAVCGGTGTESSIINEVKGKNVIKINSPTSSVNRHNSSKYYKDEDKMLEDAAKEIAECIATNQRVGNVGMDIRLVKPEDIGKLQDKVEEQLIKQYDYDKNTAKESVKKEIFYFDGTKEKNLDTKKILEKGYSCILATNIMNRGFNVNDISKERKVNFTIMTFLSKPELIQAMARLGRTGTEYGKEELNFSICESDIRKYFEENNNFNENVERNINSLYKGFDENKGYKEYDYSEIIQKGKEGNNKALKVGEEYVMSDKDAKNAMETYIYLAEIAENSEIEQKRQQDEIINATYDRRNALFNPSEEQLKQHAKKIGSELGVEINIDKLNSEDAQLKILSYILFGKDISNDKDNKEKLKDILTGLKQYVWAMDLEAQEEFINDVFRRNESETDQLLYSMGGNDSLRSIVTYLENNPELLFANCLATAYKYAYYLEEKEKLVNPKFNFIEQNIKKIKDKEKLKKPILSDKAFEYSYSLLQRLKPGNLVRVISEFSPIAIFSSIIVMSSLFTSIYAMSVLGISSAAIISAPIIGLVAAFIIGILIVKSFADRINRVIQSEDTKILAKTDKTGVSKDNFSVVISSFFNKFLNSSMTIGAVMGCALLFIGILFSLPTIVFSGVIITAVAFVSGLLFVAKNKAVLSKQKYIAKDRMQEFASQFVNGIVLGGAITVFAYLAVTLASPVVAVIGAAFVISFIAVRYIMPMKQGLRFSPKTITLGLLAGVGVVAALGAVLAFAGLTVTVGVAASAYWMFVPIMIVAFSKGFKQNLNAYNDNSFVRLFKDLLKTKMIIPFLLIPVSALAIITAGSIIAPVIFLSIGIVLVIFRNNIKKAFKFILFALGVSLPAITQQNVAAVNVTETPVAIPTNTAETPVTEQQEQETGDQSPVNEPLNNNTNINTNSSVVSTPVVEEPQQEGKDGKENEQQESQITNADIQKIADNLGEEYTVTENPSKDGTFSVTKDGITLNFSLEKVSRGENAWENTNENIVPAFEQYNQLSEPGFNVKPNTDENGIFIGSFNVNKGGFTINNVSPSSENFNQGSFNTLVNNAAAIAANGHTVEFTTDLKGNAMLIIDGKDPVYPFSENREWQLDANGNYKGSSHYSGGGSYLFGGGYNPAGGSSGGVVGLITAYIPSMLSNRSFDSQQKPEAEHGGTFSVFALIEDVINAIIEGINNMLNHYLGDAGEQYELGNQKPVTSIDNVLYNFVDSIDQLGEEAAKFGVKPEYFKGLKPALYCRYDNNGNPIEGTEVSDLSEVPENERGQYKVVEYETEAGYRWVRRKNDEGKDILVCYDKDDKMVAMINEEPISANNENTQYAFYDFTNPVVNVDQNMQKNEWAGTAIVIKLPQLPSAYIGKDGSTITFQGYRTDYTPGQDDVLLVSAEGDAPLTSAMFDFRSRQWIYTTDAFNAVLQAFANAFPDKKTRDLVTNNVAGFSENNPFGGNQDGVFTVDKLTFEFIKTFLTTIKYDDNGNPIAYVEKNGVVRPVSVTNGIENVDGKFMGWVIVSSDILQQAGENGEIDANSIPVGNTYLSVNNTAINQLKILLKLYQTMNDDEITKLNSMYPCINTVTGIFEPMSIPYHGENNEGRLQSDHIRQLYLLLYQSNESSNGLINLGTTAITGVSDSEIMDMDDIDDIVAQIRNQLNVETSFVQSILDFEIDFFGFKIKGTDLLRIEAGINIQEGVLAKNGDGQYVESGRNLFISPKDWDKIRHLILTKDGINWIGSTTDDSVGSDKYLIETAHSKIIAGGFYFIPVIAVFILSKMFRKTKRALKRIKYFLLGKGEPEPEPEPSFDVSIGLGGVKISFDKFDKVKHAEGLIEALPNDVKIDDISDEILYSLVISKGTFVKKYGELTGEALKNKLQFYTRDIYANIDALEIPTVENGEKLYINERIKNENNIPNEIFETIGVTREDFIKELERPESYTPEAIKNLLKQKANQKQYENLKNNLARFSPSDKGLMIDSLILEGLLADNEYSALLRRMLEIGLIDFTHLKETLSKTNDFETLIKILVEETVKERYDYISSYLPYDYGDVKKDEFISSFTDQFSEQLLDNPRLLNKDKKTGQIQISQGIILNNNRQNKIDFSVARKNLDEEILNALFVQAPSQSRIEIKGEQHDASIISDLDTASIYLIREMLSDIYSDKDRSKKELIRNRNAERIITLVEFNKHLGTSCELLKENSSTNKDKATQTKGEEYYSDDSHNSLFALINVINLDDKEENINLFAVSQTQKTMFNNVLKVLERDDNIVENGDGTINLIASINKFLKKADNKVDAIEKDSLYRKFGRAINKDINGIMADLSPEQKEIVEDYAEQSLLEKQKKQVKKQLNKINFDKIKIKGDKKAESALYNLLGKEVNENNIISYLYGNENKEIDDLQDLRSRIEDVESAIKRDLLNNCLKETDIIDDIIGNLDDLKTNFTRTPTSTIRNFVSGVYVRFFKKMFGLKFWNITTKKQIATVILLTAGFVALAAVSFLFTPLGATLLTSMGFGFILNSSIATVFSAIATDVGMSFLMAALLLPKMIVGKADDGSTKGSIIKMTSIFSLYYGGFLGSFFVRGLPIAIFSLFPFGIASVFGIATIIISLSVWLAIGIPTFSAFWQLMVGIKSNRMERAEKKLETQKENEKRLSYQRWGALLIGISGLSYFGLAFGGLGVTVTALPVIAAIGLFVGIGLILYGTFKYLGNFNNPSNYNEYFSRNLEQVYEEAPDKVKFLTDFQVEVEKAYQEGAISKDNRLAMLSWIYNKASDEEIPVENEDIVKKDILELLGIKEENILKEEDIAENNSFYIENKQIRDYFAKSFEMMINDNVEINSFSDIKSVGLNIQAYTETITYTKADILNKDDVDDFHKGITQFTQTVTKKENKAAWKNACEEMDAILESREDNKYEENNKATAGEMERIKDFVEDLKTIKATETNKLKDYNELGLTSQQAIDTYHEIIGVCISFMEGVSGSQISSLKTAGNYTFDFHEQAAEINGDMRYYRIVRSFSTKYNYLGQAVETIENKKEEDRTDDENYFLEKYEEYHPALKDKYTPVLTDASIWGEYDNIIEVEDLLKYLSIEDIKYKNKEELWTIIKNEAAKDKKEIKESQKNAFKKLSNHAINLIVACNEYGVIYNLVDNNDTVQGLDRNKNGQMATTKRLFIGKDVILGLDAFTGENHFARQPQSIIKGSKEFLDSGAFVTNLAMRTKNVNDSTLAEAYGFGQRDWTSYVQKTYPGRTYYGKGFTLGGMLITNSRLHTAEDSWAFYFVKFMSNISNKKTDVFSEHSSSMILEWVRPTGIFTYLTEGRYAMNSTTLLTKSFSMLYDSTSIGWDFKLSNLFMISHYTNSIITVAFILFLPLAVIFSSFAFLMPFLVSFVISTMLMFAINLTKLNTDARESGDFVVAIKDNIKDLFYKFPFWVAMQPILFIFSGKSANDTFEFIKSVKEKILHPKSFDEMYENFAKYTVQFGIAAYILSAFYVFLILVFTFSNPITFGIGFGAALWGLLEAIVVALPYVFAGNAFIGAYAAYRVNFKDGKIKDQDVWSSVYKKGFVNVLMAPVILFRFFRNLSSILKGEEPKKITQVINFNRKYNTSADKIKKNTSVERLQELVNKYNSAKEDDNIKQNKILGLIAEEFGEEINKIQEKKVSGTLTDEEENEMFIKLADKLNEKVEIKEMTKEEEEQNKKIEGKLVINSLELIENYERNRNNYKGSEDDITNQLEIDEEIRDLFIPRYDVNFIKGYKVFLNKVANFIFKYPILKSVIIPAAKGIFIAGIASVVLTFILSFTGVAAMVGIIRLLIFAFVATIPILRNIGKAYAKKDNSKILTALFYLTSIPGLGIPIISYRGQKRQIKETEKQLTETFKKLKEDKEEKEKFEGKIKEKIKEGSNAEDAFMEVLLKEDLSTKQGITERMAKFVYGLIGKEYKKQAISVKASLSDLYNAIEVKPTNIIALKLASYFGDDFINLREAILDDKDLQKLEQDVDKDDEDKDDGDTGVVDEIPQENIDNSFAGRANEEIKLLSAGEEQLPLPQYSTAYRKEIEEKISDLKKIEDADEIRAEIDEISDEEMKKDLNNMLNEKIAGFTFGKLMDKAEKMEQEVFANAKQQSELEETEKSSDVVYVPGGGLFKVVSDGIQEVGNWVSSWVNKIFGREETEEVEEDIYSLDKFENISGAFGEKGWFFSPVGTIVNRVLELISPFKSKITVKEFKGFVENNNYKRDNKEYRYPQGGVTVYMNMNGDIKNVDIYTVSEEEQFEKFENNVNKLIESKVDELTEADLRDYLKLKNNKERVEFLKDKNLISETEADFYKEFFNIKIRNLAGISNLVNKFNYENIKDKKIISSIVEDIYFPIKSNLGYKDDETSFVLAPSIIGNSMNVYEMLINYNSSNSKKIKDAIEMAHLNKLKDDDYLGLFAGINGIKKSDIRLRNIESDANLKEILKVFKDNLEKFYEDEYRNNENIDSDVKKAFLRERAVNSFKVTKREAINYLLKSSVTLSSINNTISTFQNFEMTTINLNCAKGVSVKQIANFIEIAKDKGLDVNLTIDMEKDTEIINSLNSFKGLTGVYFTNVNKDNIGQVKNTINDITFSVMPDVYVKVDNTDILSDLDLESNVKIVVNSEMYNDNKNDLEKYKQNKKLVIEYENSNSLFIDDITEVFISQEVFNNRKLKNSLFNKIRNLIKAKEDYCRNGWAIGKDGFVENFDISNQNNAINKLLTGKIENIELIGYEGLTETTINSLEEIKKSSLDDKQKVEEAKKLFIGIIGKIEFDNLKIDVTNDLNDIWKEMSADQQTSTIMSLVQLRIVGVELDKEGVFDFLEKKGAMNVNDIMREKQPIFNEMLSIWNSDNIKFEDKLPKEKENKIKELVEVNLKFGDMLISERNAGSALKESFNVSYEGISALLSAA